MTNPVVQITSKDNALLKKIRLLVSGSSRAKEELVVAEGIRVLGVVAAHIQVDGAEVELTEKTGNVSVDGLFRFSGGCGILKYHIPGLVPDDGVDLHPVGFHHKLNLK